jgi:hypothetical protein
VESSCSKNPKDGDKGKSIGPYQIKYEYWYDATHDIRGNKTSDITYQDCRDKKKAEQVMIMYWRRYCGQSLKNKNYEVLARIHNGGPTGHKKESTKSYWKKVKVNL